MKPWWQSKTVWAAVITGVIGFIQTVAPVLDPSVESYLLIGVSILAVILRGLTQDRIFFKNG